MKIKLFTVPIVFLLLFPLFSFKAYAWYSTFQYGGTTYAWSQFAKEDNWSIINQGDWCNNVLITSGEDNNYSDWYLPSLNQAKAGRDNYSGGDPLSLSPPATCQGYENMGLRGLWTSNSCSISSSSDGAFFIHPLSTTLVDDYARAVLHCDEYGKGECCLKKSGYGAYHTCPMARCVRLISGVEPSPSPSLSPSPSRSPRPSSSPSLFPSPSSEPSLYCNDLIVTGIPKLEQTLTAQCHGGGIDAHHYKYAIKDDAGSTLYEEAVSGFESLSLTIPSYGLSPGDVLYGLCQTCDSQNNCTKFPPIYFYQPENIQIKSLALFLTTISTLALLSAGIYIMLKISRTGISAKENRQIKKIFYLVVILLAVSGLTLLKKPAQYPIENLNGCLAKVIVESPTSSDSPSPRPSPRPSSSQSPRPSQSPFSPPPGQCPYFNQGDLSCDYKVNDLDYIEYIDCFDDQAPFNCPDACFQCTDDIDYINYVAYFGLSW
jgi:hypothetical protein